MVEGTDDEMLGYKKEPCRHKRCKYFYNQKKCNKCGRAYANKEHIEDILKAKLTRAPVDLYITKDALRDYRLELAKDTSILAIVISFSAMILAALAGVFR